MGQDKYGLFWGSENLVNSSKPLYENFHHQLMHILTNTISVYDTLQRIWPYEDDYYIE